jgi:hypothetical protein
VTARTMIQACHRPSNFVAQRFFELPTGFPEKAQITASDSLWAIKRLAQNDN